jgi:hypothetical protein
MTASRSSHQPDIPSPARGKQPSLIGQRISFRSSDDGQCEGVVTEAHEMGRIPLKGREKPAVAKGKFIVVFMTIMNVGKRSSYVSQSGLKLKDSKDRLYDLNVVNAAASAASKHFKRSGPFTTIQPGLSEEQVFVFDVAPDSEGHVLEESHR